MSTEERSVNQPKGQPSLSERRLIRRAELKKLQDAGQDPLQVARFVVKHHSADVKGGFEGLEGAVTSVAGRIMSKRGMGKAAFCNLQDDKGRIQLYARADELGGEASVRFKRTNIDDIVDVEGEVFKTRRGEISVKVHRVTLFFKSLRPLPEKFHGLTNKEVRCHQRYVDLIVNEDVRRTFHIRTVFIKYMHRYLDEQNYLEVKIPVLNTISGGATTWPSITHHDTLGTDMYMRVATELNLKRLTVDGFERMYETGHISHNESMSPRHNPESTTIELYEAYIGFHDMMNIAGGVLSTAAKETLGSYRVTWLGNKTDLTPGWKCMTMIDAIREYMGVDFETISDGEGVCKTAEAKGIGLGGYERTWDIVPYEAFDQRVGERLIQPTFITMYPVGVSPLTKCSPKDPRLTERFELFINHCESINAFPELNDPIDQCGRFEHRLALREMSDDEVGMMDEDFTDALEYGLPPTGGMGIDIGRCVALLTDPDSIRNMILFPAIKPLDKPEPAKRAAAGINCTVPAVERGPVNFFKVEIEPLLQEFMDFETFAKSDSRIMEVKECTTMPKSKKLLKFVLGDDTGEDRVVLSGIHDTYEPEELVGKILIAIVNLSFREMMGIDSCGMIISAVHHEEGVEKLYCLMVDDHIPVGVKLY